MTTDNESFVSGEIESVTQKVPREENAENGSGYLSLSRNYEKEKAARDKTAARAEELRQEEEIFTTQIQEPKEACPPNTFYSIKSS